VGSRAGATEQSQRGRGRWLIAAATFFWGSSATVARFLFARQDVPPFWAVQMRLLIAALVLGVWLALRHPQALRVRRADWPYILVLALAGVASIQGTYYYTISELGVGLAILLQYLAPALIVAYEVLRGKERLTMRVTIVLVAALLGTFLLVSGVARSDWRAHPQGFATGLASAFFFAFYILYSKRGLARYRADTLLFYTFLIAGIAWAIASPVTKLLAAGLPLRVWGLFVYLAFCATLIPFALFSAGLSRLSPTETAIVATLEPVVAVFSSALLLDEGLRPIQTAGALFVLLACVLAAQIEPAPAIEHP
jgi:drug/metabolite transporter (DMT)-like permease